MRKIPTLFVRDETNRRYVSDEVNPDCAWVLDGQGVATRMFDGWCCQIDAGGKLWRRAEVKKDRQPQPGFLEVQFDETAGKRVGWVPVGAGPEDRWFREAFDAHRVEVWAPSGVPYMSGTYELVGPKVQGNPEGFTGHLLIRHADADVLDDCPTDADGIRKFVAGLRYEGVVWHHDDGRMAKLKARDLRP